MCHQKYMKEEKVWKIFFSCLIILHNWLINVTVNKYIKSSTGKEFLPLSFSLLSFFFLSLSFSPHGWRGKILIEKVGEWSNKRERNFFLKKGEVFLFLFFLFHQIQVSVSIFILSLSLSFSSYSHFIYTKKSIHWLFRHSSSTHLLR